MTVTPVDDAELRQTVAAVLGLDAEEIDEDEDLFRQGLDSLGLIRLAGGWRRMGLPVTFEDLAEQATLRHWRSLLAGRAQAGTPLQAAAPEVDERAPFDLATMQHAYWVGRRPGQPFGEVAAHFYVEFDGSGVDPERLDAALGALAARHAMLRARFLDDGRQRIAEEPALPHVTVRDLRGLTPEQAAARLEELREHYTHRRMDVDRGEVFEVALTLLPGGATRMHVDLDMIVADALSMRVLLGDLRTLYEGGELPPIGYSFPRYLAERGPRRAAERERARAWWRERMAGLPSAPRLPTRAEAGHADRPRTVRLHHWIDAAAKRRLLALAQQHGVTPAAALATVFAEVIGAWSGDERFLLNLPLFDRERLHPDVDLLVGDFSGSVLLDADVSGAVPFAERARLLQDRLRAAIAHGAYGGVEVLRDLRREGRDALAPVVYTSALGLGEIYDEPLQRRFGRPVWIISQGPQVWLDAQVTELDHGLLLNWDVREDVLAPGVAQAAFGAYRDLIESLLASAEAWRRPVGPLLPAGQAAVRAAVNDTGRALPSRLLHEGFFLRAAEAPGRVALIEDGGRLTYGELAASALRVAALLRAHGVRPGDSVVITLPKGGGQVAAVLGVLAAGACYVPIGVDQPAPRRARIHERAGARAVLTDENHAEAVAEAVRQAAGTAPVLLLGDADACEPLAAPVAHEADAPAYVLFTSGSTGEPKGVEVSHRAAVNTVESLNARFGIGPDDRVLTVSALDFDLSVYDVFGLLSAGGALVVVPEDARRDAAAWWRLVSRHGVTVWNTVPALLDMLLTAAGYTPHEASPALRVVLLGGDWVGLDLPGRLRAVAPGCRFAALGGMTEAAIHSTVFEVDRVDDAWRSMPWGTPLDNVRCRVVDARGRDCPDWVAGELWVGGASVANGYRGDPARTAERFVEHDGLRWYRSGDLARYRPDGVLEFLGRADHQVKVRGHRIELGEIEAALEAHPAVGRAVAAVLRGASQRLAAAVAAREPVTEQELIGWLTERLPGYMVCEHIAVRPSLPLTANGKPDRAAVLRVLAEEAGDRAETAEPPEGELESLVAKVWAELLGVDRVGRHDSFFELGGDSLLATRLVGLLRAEGVSGCRLTALFASPRLAGFAATLTLGAEEPGAPEAVPALVADPANRHEPFPPTDVQRVYWIGRDERLPLGGVGTWQYAEFDGTGVDLDRLEAAWRRLIDRHEMLRAVFDEDGDQRILAEVPEFRIEVRDATGGTDADADEALAELRRDKSHRLADLTRWPLFDVAAVRYRRGGEVRTRVAIGLDYILFDALSIMTLFSELDLLYRDPGAALAPIEMSFRDYVLQVRPDPEIAARDQEYWRSRVADLPATPRLPLTRHPAQVARPRFTRRQRWLPPGPWRAFKEAASRHGLTPSTALLACYAEILGAWSGSPELTVTLTLFNRRDVHPHIGRVLGDFTTLSLADYRPRPGEEWPEAARRLQRQMGADLDHREVSPSWLLRELARATGTMEAVPVVFTSAIGVGDGVSMDMSPQFPERVWGISQSPQVCLDNQVLESRGGLLVTWEAIDGLFCDGVLEAMFDAYNRLLDHLAAQDWSRPLPAPLPPEQRRVRDRVNATAEPLPRRLLHTAVFDAARRDPGRPALIASDGRRVSHGELAERALRVGGALAARGVGPGDTVAVTLPKGPEQIVAVLGVLAAGAAYVPVGVEQPGLRRARIYEGAGVRLVLGGPGAATDVDVLALPQAETAAPLPEPVALSPDDLAYVIFTSGSTGVPKGVEITHGAAANTVADVNRRYGVGPDDRVLAVSALDFDLSVYDVFGLLGAGGALVLPGEDERRDARRWLELAAAHDVTLWNSVPMLLDMLLVAAGGGALPPSLRLALVSGDWVGLDLPPRLAAQSEGRCRLVALGGATEASIWSNAFEAGQVAPEWTSIPYGFPLTGQRYRVVDERGRDRPDWVPGELWIGGDGVARGYRGDPGLTAAKFPVVEGRRWYRTGDLGRYWPDGTLEFLGRADHQVKIGGHRIELGEIEAAAEAHPGVARAVVVAVGDRRRRGLCGFLEPVPGSPADAGLVASLRDFLATRLPGYAVPGRFTVLNALPLTGNGKIDRAALQSLAAEEPAGALSPPRGPVEAAVAALWAELLEQPVADREANFFALGGNSLDALRLITTLRDRFGVEVTARRFLTDPTVAALAAEMARLGYGGTDDEETGTI